jgi:asparaginyl-tRNA synthetase
MRIRSNLSFAIHKYFKEKGFFYVNTPIITGSDAEGAGEMFKVTTLDINKSSLDKDQKVNYNEDFFGKETNLTVSGQLEAESLAMGLGKVYTFGPTFRAENSNTSRHLAEFWMIEPEMAFYDLNDNMKLAEEFIKSVIKDLINECKEDLDFLNQRLIDEDKSKPMIERNELSLIERLNFVVNNDFKKITYSEAFEILKNSKPNKKKKFKFPILEWGVDLQSEHERFLVEKHFKKPVIIYNYPAKIKAFYMRMNEDGKTVKAMDILFPGIGEIVGGSQREERLDVLKSRIKDLNIEEKELWWYLDLRKYGTVKHSGFGLGLERLILFATGMSNIRDVIPFPRTPKSAEF